MALGKKSFLIRDILESNSQPWTTDQQIVDWLLSSRTNELSRVEKSPLTEALDVDESHINNASLPWDLQPFIQNWLAIQAGSGSVMNLAENGYHDLWPAAWSDLEASWHLGADNIGNDLRPTSSVMVQAHSQLYRHLYYAALQQQMNATSEASKSLVETNPCTLMSPLAKPCASPTNSTLASGQSNSIRRRASKRNAEEGLCKSKKKVFKVSQAQNSSKKKEKHKHSNLMDVNTEATKPVNGTNVDETTWTNLVESDIDDVEASNASDETAISSYRKLRRNRTVFTELQLMGLERRFDSQKYLSTPDRADLAQALGLTQLQVKTWYQNRRMKWKKQVMQNGCPYPPTKPKGRPKKDSIPTYGIEFTNQILCPIFASHNSNTV